MMAARHAFVRPLALALALGTATAAAAQAPCPVDAPDTSSGVTPAGYTIGPDDVLEVTFWREKDMSAEVTVRPDGFVALPLLNDVQAAGLTPAAFRDRVLEAAKRFVEDPNPTIMVKTINSRRVFVIGQVEKPGPYPMNTSATVLQVIAMAGGLREFAHGKDIAVLRNDGGRQTVYRFNYQDVLRRRNLDQNIELRPGDTVVVP